MQSNLLCAQVRERIGEEETAGLQRAKARLAARAAQEEELMARVPLSRGERKNLKAQRRAGLSGGVMLDDFADDVADLIQVITCNHRQRVQCWRMTSLSSADICSITQCIPVASWMIHNTLGLQIGCTRPVNEELGSCCLLAR